MAYLGTQPAVGSYKRVDDISASFNDSTTQFNLTSGGDSIVVQSPQSLLVSVDGVLQEPVSAYNATGGTITFTEAPNTNATFFAILLGDTLDVGIPSDDTVSAAKLQTDSVIAAKIATSAVVNAKLNANAVSAGKISSDAIENRHLADNIVQEVHIVDDSVSSDKIQPLTNLFENAEVIASAALANVSINVLNNSVRFFTGNNDKNFCINLRGDDSTTLNNSMDTGNSITTALIVTNGSTAYFASNTQVDNVLVVPKVQGGSQLSGGNASSTDIYTITVLKTADATFTMFLSQTQFA
jgi:hypothetical protein